MFYSLDPGITDLSTISLLSESLYSPPRTTLFGQVAINYSATFYHPDDNSIELSNGPELFKYYEDNFDHKTFAMGRNFFDSKIYYFMPKRHFGSKNFKTQSILRSALRSILQRKR